MSRVRFLPGGTDPEAIAAATRACEAGLSSPTHATDGPWLVAPDRATFDALASRITRPLAGIDVSLRTSGSTDGRGRLVGLSWDALRASADATLDRLGGPGQWVTSLPTTSVAGFQVVLRGVLAGVPPVVHRPGTPWDAGLRAGVRHYLSLVPTQLVRELAADPGPLARFDAVLIGGAALAPEPAGRARRAGVRIVTTYGMTETCGGCVHGGAPLAGVRVRVVAGRIQLAGPMLAEAYLDAGPQPFVDGPDGRWLVTGDRGRWDGARLRVDGRADDVILSGGVNVDPHRVEAALAALGGEWVVVGVPDPEWGQRVVAVTTGAADLADVRAATAHLAPAERPRGVTRLAAWPMTATGKVDRRVVATRASGGVT